MKEYEYQRNYELEEKNWYFVGMRQVFLSLIKRYRPVGGERLKIADIGCGTGIILEQLEKLGETIGVDNSSEAIKFCRSRGLSHVKVEDATAMSLPKDHFDIVTALGLIEHVPDDRLLLAELKRISRRGGRIILFTSALSILWSEHDEANEHVRRYSKSELKEKIEEQGLKIIKLSYFNLAMFFPMLVVVQLKKSIKKIRAERELGPRRFLFELPRIVSAMLVGLLRLEEWLFVRTGLPFGVNLIGILEKT